MSVVIGMMSSNGVILAGQGKTTAAALDGFVNLLGEDAEIAFAKAHGELEKVVSAIADKYDPRGESPDGAVARSVGGEADSDRPAGDTETGAADGSTVETTADEDDAGEPEGRVRGGVRRRDVETRSGNVATEERGETEGSESSEEKVTGKPECAVCGVTVGAGRAEISEEEYGEVRCKGCSG